MNKTVNFQINSEYKSWIRNLKKIFRQVQIKAAVKVNSTLLEFYWQLGYDIVEKQKNISWGSGFLKQLSADLKKEFPDIKGFSVNNLQYIIRWFSFYSNGLENMEQPVPHLKSEIKKEKLANAIEIPFPQLFQIPWGHNLVIISKSNTIDEAFFYVENSIKHGWSRAVLTHQIESGLYQRQGQAITNFEITLPKVQSELARELIKDPYKFDFLSLGKEFNERELENALLDHITNFLLELGNGFAFLGRQKALQVGEKEFFIDLLFYHTIMHCYVVIELKVVDFEPEFAGKLNFYLKAIDKQVKTGQDNPTIGLLICKSKDQTVVEYALSDIYKPMAVSEYHLTHILPEHLKKNLPSIEAIKANLDAESNK